MFLFGCWKTVFYDLNYQNLQILQVLIICISGMKIRFFEANNKLLFVPIIIGITLVDENNNFEVERRKSKFYFTYIFLTKTFLYTTVTKIEYTVDNIIKDNIEINAVELAL